MSLRIIIGMGLAGILAVALALGAVHLKSSQTSAQVVPPDVAQCLNEVADFNDSGAFDIEDILVFADAFGAESCDDPNYNAAVDHDGDCDVDVFDIVGFAKDVRDCVLGGLPNP